MQGLRTWMARPLELVYLAGCPVRIPRRDAHAKLTMRVTVEFLDSGVSQFNHGFRLSISTTPRPTRDTEISQVDTETYSAFARWEEFARLKTDVPVQLYNIHRHRE